MLVVVIQNEFVNETDSLVNDKKIIRLIKVSSWKVDFTYNS